MHSRDPVIASLHHLMVFTQSVRVHRMISEIALEPKQTFWNMTLNLLFDTAAVEWSKVFGSRREETHWTKVLPADKHDETRAALLRHLGLSAERWQAQRDVIVTYRDQHVSHHDVDSTLPKLPHYDTALSAALFMFDRIREAADQNWLGGIPTALDSWSKTVAGNMRVIVSKAHSATKTLPSNILA